MLAHEHFLVSFTNVSNSFQIKLLIRIQVSFFNNLDKMTKYATLYKLTKE